MASSFTSPEPRTKPVCGKFRLLAANETKVLDSLLRRVRPGRKGHLLCRAESWWHVAFSIREFLFGILHVIAELHDSDYSLEVAMNRLSAKLLEPLVMVLLVVQVTI
jgi:hypothetical protein